MMYDNVLLLEPKTGIQQEGEKCNFTSLALIGQTVVIVDLT